MAMVSVTPVHAGLLDDSYLAVQIASLQFKDSNKLIVTPKALFTKLGKNINAIFSVEARYGFGIESVAKESSGVTVTTRVESILSALIIARYNVKSDASAYGLVNDIASVYALVGFSDVSFSAIAQGAGGTATGKAQANGLSFGAGSTISIGKNIAFNLEYIQYLTKSTDNTSAFSVGIHYNF